MTSTPPTTASAVFNNKDLSNWVQRNGDPATWIVADGIMTVASGDIMTKELFTDFRLHLEFMTPDMPEATGQAKGNSGVFLQGRYEIQVLDSYGIEVPGKGDCGAVYDQFAPLVNACKPPLEWQTYDVFFRALRCNEDNQIVDPARLTVLQNGIVIHNNVQLLGVTGGSAGQNVREPGPLLLQDHGDLLKYRNIWIEPLLLEGSDKY
ncbi:TPA: DUF1080 domain-containing protein [Candidatus Poribacteria bacterium]|nr:DUF1080 domain-containing protein [Candidatus Poribacteria bacterium]